MRKFYSIDDLKFQFTNYISTIKNQEDVGTVGEIAVNVLEFIDYLQQQSAKEEEK